MNLWPGSQGTTPTLFGADGELVLLNISVDPRLLEDLLEALSRLPFPVNPDLAHKSNAVTVTFPAYSGRIEDVKKLLGSYGFDKSCVSVEHALIAHV